MKGLPILLCGVLILMSCDKYTLNRVYRTQVLTEKGHGSSLDDDHARNVDTIVYVSAIIVPDDYDWRKDSCYGEVPCELQLLKNGIPVLSVAAGAGHHINISPNTHHLMGGHIYTEYASSDGTFISRDGVELFHFPQRERLKGLLIKDGDIYTLGLDLDGSGFTYRRNGEVLLRQDSGSVFGDFANTSYGRSGALYADSGAVCFCFKNSVACYSVRNGVMTEEKTTSVASRVIDMRLLESSVYYIANYKGIMIAFSPTGSRTINAETVLQTANLFMHDGEVWFCADAADYTICRSVREAGLLSSGIIFRGGGNFIYDAGKQLYAANFRDGILSIRDGAGEYIYIRDSAFFFGPGNISCVGEDVFALVNSRERKVLPALWHGGSTFEYRLNGYLTDMEVEINPPR